MSKVAQSEDEFIGMMKEAYKQAIYPCVLAKADVEETVQSAYTEYMLMEGCRFGDPEYIWDAEGAREIVMETLLRD